MGTHATKIKNVSGEVGHDTQRSMPPSIEANRKTKRLKRNILVKIKD
jgi:hypothetical protein